MFQHIPDSRIHTHARTHMCEFYFFEKSNYFRRLTRKRLRNFKFALKCVMEVAETAIVLTMKLLEMKKEEKKKRESTSHTLTQNK